MTLDKSDMKPDCICYCLPKEGNYIIGNKYKWEYIIDGICVFDEEGDIANYIHLQYNHYIDIMRVDGKEKIVMRGLVS